jgi:hypothetical protein
MAVLIIKRKYQYGDPSKGKTTENLKYNFLKMPQHISLGYL